MVTEDRQCGSRCDVIRQSVPECRLLVTGKARSPMVISGGHVHFCGMVGIRQSYHKLYKKSNIFVDIVWYLS